MQQEVVEVQEMVALQVTEEAAIQAGQGVLVLVLLGMELLILGQEAAAVDSMHRMTVQVALADLAW